MPPLAVPSPVCSERALAAVKLAPEDVELVVRELDLTVAEASLRLREANGDVYALLSSYVSS